MNFGDALEAMTEGKKVTGSCIKDGCLELFLRIHRESTFEKEHVLRYSKESYVIDYILIPVNWLLSDDWKIVDKTSRAIVKTKPIEYVVCPKCGKELEVTKIHKYGRYCGFCGTQIQLIRDQKRGSLL